MCRRCIVHYRKGKGTLGVRAHPRPATVNLGKEICGEEGRAEVEGVEGTQRPDEAWEGPCLPAQQVPRPGEVEAGSWPSVYKGQSPVPQGYGSDPEEVRKPAVSASTSLCCP